MNRPKIEGNLATKIEEELLPEVQSTLDTLEWFMKHELPGLVIRNLSGAHRELIKVKLSIKTAAFAATDEGVQP